MMSDSRDLHDQFRCLASDGNHEAIVALLLPRLSQNELQPSELGWAYWTVCDRLALQRDWERQYPFQQAFFSFLSESFGSSRLHWAVSDGTQAMTLISGGYQEYWQHWYDMANEQSNRDESNRGVRFEAHRAFAYSFNRLGAEKLTARSLEFLDELVEEDPSWEGRRFAELSLLTLRLDHLHMVQDELEKSKTARALRERVESWAVEPTTSDLRAMLLGSWKQLNQARPTDVRTAAGNAGCALCRVSEYEQSLRCFEIAQSLGLTENSYMHALHLAATWKTSGNKHAFESGLRSNPQVAATLAERAPEILASGR